MEMASDRQWCPAVSTSSDRILIVGRFRKDSVEECVASSQQHCEQYNLRMRVANARDGHEWYLRSRYVSMHRELHQ